MEMPIYVMALIVYMVGAVTICKLALNAFRSFKNDSMKKKETTDE